MGISRGFWLRGACASLRAGFPSVPGTASRKLWPLPAVTRHRVPILQCLGCFCSRDPGLPAPVLCNCRCPQTPSKSHVSMATNVFQPGASGGLSAINRVRIQAVRGRPARRSGRCGGRSRGGAGVRSQGRSVAAHARPCVRLFHSCPRQALARHTQVFSCVHRKRVSRCCFMKSGLCTAFNTIICELPRRIQLRVGINVFLDGPLFFKKRGKKRTEKPYWSVNDRLARATQMTRPEAKAPNTQCVLADLGGGLGVWRAPRVFARYLMHAAAQKGK